MAVIVFEWEKRQVSRRLVGDARRKIIPLFRGHRLERLSVSFYLQEVMFCFVRFARFGGTSSSSARSRSSDDEEMRACMLGLLYSFSFLFFSFFAGRSSFAEFWPFYHNKCFVENIRSSFFLFVSSFGGVYGGRVVVLSDETIVEEG